MARWGDIAGEAPELVEQARVFLDSAVHKTVATLRRDGSPRISGIEIAFADDEVYMTSMPRSVKALDLLRDHRFALHSASVEQPSWRGDAKFSGTAVEITDAAVKTSVVPGGSGEFHLFACDVAELVVVRLGEPADHLVIESWHPGRGVTTLRR